LLERSDLSAVTVFVRKIQNPFPGLSEAQAKSALLQQKLVEYENIEKYSEELQDHSIVFCCLGTTRDACKSDEEFVKIDQTYVLNAAKIAKSKGVSHFSIVSSIGADVNSSFLYTRSKGQTEEGLKKIAFDHLSIFRPSFLEAQREEGRWKEKLGGAFSWMFHFTPSMKAIKVEQVAKAMIVDAFKTESSKKSVETFENDVIHKM